MKVFDVVTVGNALKDILFHSDGGLVLPERKTGEKFLAFSSGVKATLTDLAVNYGGGAMNVAVGLKNFGLSVAPLVCVGRDTVGKEIFAEMKRCRLATDLLAFSAKARTGFSLIPAVFDASEHAVLTHYGANEFLSLPNLRSFQAKCFYLSSLASDEWLKILDLVTRQTRRGSLVIWNPGAKQLAAPRQMAKYFKFIDVLILNLAEARYLQKALGGRQTSTAKGLLNFFKQAGLRRVIITAGKDGLTALDEENKVYSLKPYPTKKKIKDTVGAGDAFASGFVAGWLRWHDFDNALRLGLRNSSEVITKVGAQNGLLKVNL